MNRRDAIKAAVGAGLAAMVPGVPAVAGLPPIGTPWPSCRVMKITRCYPLQSIDIQRPERVAAKWWKVSCG